MSRSRATTMIAFLVPLLVCLLAIAAYYVGVFDRPPFEYHESLMPNVRELYAIVAVTQETDISKHVVRLLNVSKAAVDALPQGAAMMTAAAKAYDLEATQLGVGVWLDNPKKAVQPRWAMGWAVAADDFATVQKLARGQQEASGLKEAIKAVRLGKDHVLKARIPWKSVLTPMIAPMLHWDRAFSAYTKGGYASTAKGRTDGAIALEVYVTGENEKHLYIDYAVLMGDTSHTWDDLFPLSNTKPEEATKAVPKVEEKVERKADVKEKKPPVVKEVPKEDVKEEKKEEVKKEEVKKEEVKQEEVKKEEVKQEVKKEEVKEEAKTEEVKEEKVAVEEPAKAEEEAPAVEIPVAGEAHQDKGEEIPVAAEAHQNKGEEIPVAGEAHQEKVEEIPVAGEAHQEKVEDIPVVEEAHQEVDEVKSTDEAEGGHHKNHEETLLDKVEEFVEKIEAAAEEIPKVEEPPVEEEKKDEELAETATE